jgi:peroxiredoxin family protein
METRIAADIKPANDRIHRLEEELQALKKQLDSQQSENKVNIICFSREWDRLFAALSIASGALALGTEVHLFFTFWAVSALRDPDKKVRKKRALLQKVFGRIMPAGFTAAPISNCQSMGIGKFFLKKLIKKKGIDDIDVLFKDVMELGAQLHVCETSTVMFGLDCEELQEGDKINMCGVTTFLSHALKSKMTLFI